MTRRAALLLLGLALAAGEAAAQGFDLDAVLPPGEAAASSRIIQVTGLVTVLSLAPGLLIMVTCFTRFVVVLSFLRAGLGLPGMPANIVLVSLALFMTFHVMAPAFDQAWRDGVEPLARREISEQVALERIAAPFRAYMATQVRPKDLQLFRELSRQRPAAEADAETEPALAVLVPAFMISELRRGFEMGFLVILPFLVIDLVVATLTMSMGMMMLPPTLISLPFKVLFFVLIDGWNLLVGGLLRSVT